MQTPKNMNVQAEQSATGTAGSTPAPSTTASAAAAHFFFAPFKPVSCFKLFGVEEVEVAEAMCSGVPSPRLSPFVFFPAPL